MVSRIYTATVGEKSQPASYRKGTRKLLSFEQSETKVVEEPLFKSYVFVKVDNNDRIAVRMTNGAINFVYWDGKPAVIKEKEINAIKRFLNEYENVEANPVDLKVNQRVRITNGTLMDKEGKVLDVRHKTVKVAIESLGYILVAYIERTKLTSAQSK